MLGRKTKPKRDLIFALKAVADTAYRGSAQIGDIAAEVQDRIASLSVFDDFAARDALTAECEQVYQALIAAELALEKLSAARKLYREEVRRR